MFTLFKGRPGPRGEVGIIGERGAKGERGDSIKGQKGEPGISITRTEGSAYSYGEVQIRDICSNIIQGYFYKHSEYVRKMEFNLIIVVLLEKLAELRESFVGVQGPQGTNNYSTEIFFLI